MDFVVNITTFVVGWGLYITGQVKGVTPLFVRRFLTRQVIEKYTGKPWDDRIYTANGKDVYSLERSNFAGDDDMLVVMAIRELFEQLETPTGLSYETLDTPSSEEDYHTEWPKAVAAASLADFEKKSQPWIDNPAAGNDFRAMLIDPALVAAYHAYVWGIAAGLRHANALKFLQQEAERNSPRADSYFREAQKFEPVYRAGLEAKFLRAARQVDLVRKAAAADRAQRLASRADHKANHL